MGPSSLIRQRPFLEQLHPVTVEWLEAHADMRTLRPGDVLFSEGNASLGLFLIKGGLLRIERLVSTGQRQVLTLAGRGDTIGEMAVLDGSPRSATAVAIQRSNLLFIGQRDIDHAMQTFPDLPLAIARCLADRLKALTDQFVEVTTGTALSRTASRVAQLVDPTVQSGRFDIEVRVSQAELAAWAGLSREGIVGALRELRLRGVVETSRRRLSVLDVAELRRLIHSL